jgi:hypothetical protein
MVTAQANPDGPNAGSAGPSNSPEKAVGGRLSLRRVGRGGVNPVVGAHEDVRR